MANRKFEVLAASIARHPDNKTVGSFHDRYIEVLHKAGEYKTEEVNRILQRELEKRKYVLRRALVEYRQIVKDKDAATGGAGARSLSEVESLVEDELGEAFVELVEFVRKNMDIKHDDFVYGVHEGARVKDYSRILDQLDAGIHGKFKQNPIVGCPDIAKVASDLTGIPASWFIIEERRERYMRLKQQLLKRVFGETSEIIEIIVQTLLWKTARDDGGCSGRGPLGLFLFMGQNGVGKAELARAIAGELYDKEDRLVRINMAEYAEPDSVSGLVDSLTRTMNTRPCSVLLFDKIEKSHYTVTDYLSRVLSAGKNGIDFQNTLIIITTDLMFHSGGLTKLIDDVIAVDWPSDLKDCSRILLRDWAVHRSNIEGNNKPVILCSSKSALMEMETNAGVATVKGLEIWLEERVFPVLSKMASEYDGVAENIIIHIDKEEETGELSFSFQ